MNRHRLTACATATGVLASTVAVTAMALTMHPAPGAPTPTAQQCATWRQQALPAPPACTLIDERAQAQATARARP